MMVHLLSQKCYPGHEGECLIEVAELIFLLYSIPVALDFPSTLQEWLQQRITVVRQFVSL